MDESDWLDDGQKEPQKKVIQSPKEESRGWGGRRGPEMQAEKKENHDQPKRQQTKEQKKQQLQNNRQMSLWVLDALKEDQSPQQEQIKGVRGKPFAADMSYALKGEQLQPDKQINTSWVAPEKPQPATAKSGNRGNRDPPKQSQKQKDQPKEADDQQPAPRRGNREPASNFQKNRPYQDDRGYNNPRSYAEREQGGYRGRGRGRGRGNYQGGGYWGREGQEQGNGRYRQSDNQGFKKRDNHQYKPRNFQTDSQSAPSRGNRNDNYQNRQYNYNGNRRDNYNNYRSDNREGGQNNASNRNYNNRDRIREYNRDYNDNREYNNNRQEKEPSAFFKKPQFIQRIQPQPVKEPVKTVLIQKEEPLIPKGRRCWPESSIYILGCRFAVTYRPINQFRSKLMVIPYASLKMDYYPGNLINLSEVDYKARILAKGEAISSAGSVYLQKAISIGSFAGLAFLKIDEKRVDDSLKLGVKKLLGQVQQIEGAQLNTIVFPICDQLGGVETVICSFLQNLQNCKKIKEVYITTRQADCFMDSMKIFTSLVQEMLDENKILIY